MRWLSERFFHRPRSRPVFLRLKTTTPFSNFRDTSMLKWWTQRNIRLRVGEEPCTLQNRQGIETADQNRRCCRVARFCGCSLFFLGGGSL